MQGNEEKPPLNFNATNIYLALLNEGRLGARVQISKSTFIVGANLNFVVRTNLDDGRKVCPVGCI